MTSLLRIVSPFRHLLQGAWWRFGGAHLRRELTGLHAEYLLRSRYPDLTLEPGVQFKSEHLLTLGRQVTVQANAIVNCGGMEWCNYRGGITLGDQVAIGPNCVLYGTGGIELGAYTHLGPGVSLISQSGDPTSEKLGEPLLRFEPIKIGRGCWIGTGSVILGGTVLGDFCTVAPNSVVRGEYKENTILVGNPARQSLRTDRVSSAPAAAEAERCRP